MSNGWMNQAWLAVVVGAAVVGCGPAKFAPEPIVDAGPPMPPPMPMVDAGPPPAPVAGGPCDPVALLAMTTMLQGRASAEAPGMKPDGQPVCGVVPEGQPLSGPTFMLEQGYCYTFLAQSLPNVAAMDVQLELDLAGAGLPPALAALQIKPVLAVDSGPGVQTSIAAKQSCYSWVFPVPAMVKLVLKATTGTGPIAAQAFRKKR